MPVHRLLRALESYDPRQSDQIFGDEFAGDPIRPNTARAPVQRIALVAESFLPKVDGVSKTAYLTLRYLQATGREVLVFTPDKSPATIGDSRIVRLPSFAFPFAPETRIAVPNWRMSGELKAFQPDIVHLFSPALLSAGAVFAGRRRGLPLIATYQTDLPAYAHHYGYAPLAGWVRDSLRWVHNNCHLTLAPSYYTLHQLQGWNFHRLRRWGRGVNIQRFNPAHRSTAWREKLLHGRDPDSLICLYVGRLASEKRLDLLLEVARTPGVALTIIGDGPLREPLERQFAGTGTHFIGYLYGTDLASAYASADVFTFTGAAETFGQVVQEAQASGLPSVVINEGGVADLVENGKNGYRCEANLQAFAAAVQRLRDDAALRAQLASGALASAQQHPWSAVMGQLENYYSEALSLNQRLQRATPPPRLDALFR